jgi:uncharacterized protein YdaL
MTDIVNETLKSDHNVEKNKFDSKKLITYLMKKNRESIDSDLEKQSKSRKSIKMF